jgi:alkaline phosphatase D
LPVIAHAPAAVSAASDWTTRVLVAGLMPAQVYWYRFTDADGNGSRLGRTMTAPTVDDPRPVNFAFVSCQTVNEGSLNAYRRMIFEDERAAQNDQLAFVLHLGDFIYEVVQYPEEAKTRYDRTIYEVARLPDGHKVGNFHIPLTVDGYRAVYKGYLHDPDLQDARARWPFVAIWDNHDFHGRLAERREAGPFERRARPRSPPIRRGRISPRVARRADRRAVRAACGQERPDREFDANGLGVGRTTSSINSLKAYRTLRYGKHLDLIITDRYSYQAPTVRDDSLGKLGDWAISTACSPRTSCRCSTPGAPSTGTIRQRSSDSKTGTSRTRRRTRRRIPFSEPSRRPGSRTS